MCVGFWMWRCCIGGLVVGYGFVLVGVLGCCCVGSCVCVECVL